jgi:hypothetical protein
MNRKPAELLTASVASVLLTASLAACHPLATNPAGRLAYPGAKLTSTSPESFGHLTRKYSFVSRPTAGQVLAWYTTKMSSYGYHPSGTLNPTSAHVSQRFEDGKHYVFVGVGLAHPLTSPRQYGGARVSAQALRQGASSLSVTIEDG